MPQCLEPKLGALPAAQREIWPSLAPASDLNFVLYEGTAVALHLGHRVSVDFDFSRSEPLNKDQVRETFKFFHGADVLQDTPDTPVVLAKMPSGPVKISLFGNINSGRVNDPLRTCDGIMLVASLDDLMATKLKTTLQRAEAKDYRDIAAMIDAGVSLPIGLSSFRKMFDGEPAQVLRALGFFEDGDLKTLGAADREALRAARDQVGNLPAIQLKPGSLAGP